MAKTIRSHPASHVLVPEPFLFDYSYIFKILSKNGPTFSSFSYLPTCKRLAPKGKKMRMDHPFILGFCQNVTFDMVSTIIFSLFGQNPFS